MRSLRAAGFLFAVLLAGCGDDDGPTKPPTPAGPTYPVRSTPQNALECLRRAYMARDTVETESVYDAEYQGLSAHVTDPIGTLPLVFTKIEELSHVGMLRRSPDVMDVVVNMGPTSGWVRGASLDVTHPEWASITISRGIQVEITTGITMYSVGTDDFFEYQFAPTTPAPSSPTDTLWSVVRWRELKGAGG